MASYNCTLHHVARKGAQKPCYTDEEISETVVF